MGRNNSGECHIQRQAQHYMQTGPDKAGALPSKVPLQKRRQWPANGAGKARNQCDARNEIASIPPIDPDQRCECGFIETTCHGETDDHPSGKQMPCLCGQAKAYQPKRENQAAERQHGATTPHVDQSPGVWPKESRNHQSNREGTEHGCGAYAQISRYRCRKNRRQVIARGPAQSLRRTQANDCDGSMGMNLDACCSMGCETLPLSLCTKPPKWPTTPSQSQSVCGCAVTAGRG